MRRTVVAILAMLTLTSALSSCNSKTDSKPKVKSKQEIIADLANCADFWFYVAPGQSTSVIKEYTVKDIDINSRTADTNYDTTICTVTAESPYAIYTGNFLIKYLFQEDSGYSLWTVYQEVPGTYEITALPSNKYLENQYEATSLSDTLFDVSVQSIEGTNTSCLVTYQHQYDENAYCTVNETFTCPCSFSNGGWLVDFSEMAGLDISRQYHDIPDITIAEIQDGIRSAVPFQIGTYDIESGTIEPTSESILVSSISGCRILSSNSNIYDTSEILVDLQMQFDPSLGRWFCSVNSITGDICFSPAGTYDLTWESLWSEPHPIAVEIMGPITWNNDLETFYVEVITTDDDPPFNRFLTPGEAIHRTMEFGAMAYGTNSLGETYFLRDNDENCYIYFDENLKPLSFLYSSS